MAVHYGVAGVKSLITGTLLSVIEFPAPVSCLLNRLRMQIGAPNAEGDTLFDVKVNGVSLYATPEDRPKIEAGETVSETFPAMDLDEGDMISVDVVAAPLGGIIGLYVLVQLQDAPTVQQYVETMYRGALKREPTTEELDNAVLALETACAASSTLDDTKDLIDLIFNSAEYDALGTSDEQFIEDLYLAVLGRSSDAGGKAFYLARIDTLWTRQEIQDIFNTSTEHVNTRVGGWCGSTLALSNAVQLQGHSVANITPTSAQVLAWNDTNTRWEPVTFGLADDGVTNAKLANMANATIKGRTTAGTGDPEDLSASQATALLNAFVGDSGAGGTKGLVPAPAAGDAAASKFLKSDGTWATASGGASSSSQFLMAQGQSGADTVTASATRFSYPNSFNTAANLWQNVESPLGFVIPANGTIDHLFVKTTTTQSGTGQFVVTLRKNQADTVLTLTIAAGTAAGTFTDNTHSVAVSAGDIIQFKGVNSATTTSANVPLVSVRYTPS